MNKVARMRNVIRSARGNTLVGLMIGLAIVEISGTAMVGAFSQFNRQAAVLDAKNAGEALATEMADEMSKLATCTAAINTTQPLVRETDGSYLISMKVPSLPDVLLASGTGKVLDPYGVTVKKFYLDRLTDTGLKGNNGKELFSGDVKVKFESATDGGIQMRDQTVTQLFVEVENSMVISCSSGDDPTVALAFACQRAGGDPTSDQQCNMGRLSESIIKQARDLIDDKLNNEYYNLVIAKANKKIQDSAATTYTRSTVDSFAYTSAAAAVLNSAIASDTMSANGSITNVNNALNQNAADLWAGINNVNSQSAYAQSLSNNANANSSTANGRSANAQSLSAGASSNATYAIQVSNNADANSNVANNQSNQANSISQSSNALTNQANSIAGTANSYVNAANNATNAANGSSNWANQTSSSANNYASSAYTNSANANNLSTNAINTYNWANAVSNDANNNSNSANGYSAQANAWANASLSRPGYQEYSSGYTVDYRNCVIGGGSCYYQ